MLCQHLQPILEFELSIGNEIYEFIEGWPIDGKTLDLKNAISVERIGIDLDISREVTYWEFRSPHEHSNQGYFCGECKQSIGSPWRETYAQNLVCSHLLPILKFELDRGNTIFSLYQDQDQLNLRITLMQKVLVKRFDKRKGLFKTIEVNKADVYCRQCNQSLVGSPT
ncbi:hypothetical protein [Mechercharimyces sp. CAU 1602]|uniref:hypothetical protein n=1 Tax=Mechercharimyces sp. CAU 1602 TaxID=2973933 RepID=UPI002161995F|nr:hypothetical protein [Mechercharimyces sp. CAU 1602]MCS1350898.1 hypothetical protein [Mechercharimyces sp. CAU 1602]